MSNEPKISIFICYNHIDEYFKNKLNEIIGDKFTINSSPQRYDIKNDFNKYVEELSKENTGARNIFIVLMGSETYKSKNVNWEIDYALHHDACMLGLCLPTNDDYLKRNINTSKMPRQFVNNLLAGYVSYFDWTDEYDNLANYIKFSCNRKNHCHALI
ncbi:TIR domain-containing protein [uncultured Methanosphaera sp.]|uniref:TIR domain-containing protein n=1 Tax=uncultured Methanosphaera sp. TaxID=262501 RepID=UPI000DC4996D|nr:TIR domain-containing protein [uncultured Methanosphaera sp.]RAP43590.1 MAG: hypothetical protein BZ134_06395 [Methanosphaera sp. SHI1033]